VAPWPPALPRVGVLHAHISMHACATWSRGPGRQAGRGLCGHVHTCRANACSHMATRPACVATWPGMRGQCGPFAFAWSTWSTCCAGVFWRGRSVDNVDNVAVKFKSLAYNTVYSYCIHFTLFTLFIFLLSTWSTTPIFSGAPCGQFMARASPTILPTWSTFCKIIVYIGFWRGYVNQSLTSVGTILLCYIGERVRFLTLLKGPTT
jgi:hypothetical protein